MKIFVAEITAAINSSGTTQTFYVTNGNGFTTKPSDVPANTPISPCLLTPGDYRREMFSGGRTFGAVRPSYGYAILNNRDGAFDGWREYGFDARTYVLRWGEEGAAYPSEFTTILVATMEGIVMDYSEVRISLRDNLQLLQKPVSSETFAGTGGIEGPSELSGQAKQRVFGLVQYPPPQLIDRVPLTYFITTGTGVVSAVWDKGVQLSPTSPGPANMTELLTVPPAAGEYNVIGTGPVILRLGSNPDGDLRIQVTGKQANGSDWTLPAFLSEAGFNGTVTGSMDPTGHLVEDSSTTYLDLLTENAMRLGKYFGFTRTNTFEVKDFAAPTGTPAYTFTRQNTETFVRSPPDGAPVPAYKISINAGKSWPSELAGSASITRTEFSRDPWYVKYSFEDRTILNKHPSADAITLEVQPRMSNAQCVLLKNKYQSWFFVNRDQVTVKCLFSEELLDLDIGSVVKVQMPRFGYDAGKLFTIVSTRYDFNSKRIEFVLWG